MQEEIKASFTESIQTKIAAAEALPDDILAAAQMMVMCLLNGNKLLVCGNGGSNALAQLFVSELINRYETERPALPAMCLTLDTSSISAIAVDHHFDDAYARQIRALGQAGDVLVVISTSGHSRNLIKAAEAALSRDMTIVTLSGGDGGELAGLLGPNDVEIRVPALRAPRIHEVNLLTLHCLCDLIDRTLFPSQEDRP
ncbi:SIS domain-containing protein [Oceanimonas sp. MB9]|uniref:D-sedoheptulose-7-phosphate isomerase n=1 Tax=Oceanimonas sp. MB9 TaxID=2588453 RepID=UPI0013F619C2|nr:SIS domain-containing protein [Oceanimonas sp. MB9]NHI01183.1 DnaA initiator-associating protein DiaA [Oceanimonas sp. MB9]